MFHRTVKDTKFRSMELSESKVISRWKGHYNKQRTAWFPEVLVPSRTLASFSPYRLAVGLGRAQMSHEAEKSPDGTKTAKVLSPQECVYQQMLKTSLVFIRRQEAGQTNQASTQWRSLKRTEM